MEGHSEASLRATLVAAFLPSITLSRRSSLEVKLDFGVVEQACPVVLALERLKKEDHEFKVSYITILRPVCYI